MAYQYPLQIRFKLLAFAPQISVTDADGREVLYIGQKLFALRETIPVYNTQTEKKQVYGIKTRQVSDFGFYNRADEVTPKGPTKEEGLKTLYRQLSWG